MSVCRVYEVREDEGQGMLWYRFEEAETRQPLKLNLTETGLELVPDPDYRVTGSRYGPRDVLLELRVPDTPPLAWRPI